MGMVCKKVSVVLMVSFVSLQAEAGGLWLNEYGTPAMGKAGAGRYADASPR